MTTSSAVQAAGLCVRRGRQPVLHDLTFDVPAGSITGLLGPSGCGKTTLMRAIVGIQTGVTGRLLVLGQRPGTPSLRQRVGYVTQQPAVYADLSVRANLRYFADAWGVPHRRLDQVLRDVSLTGQAGQLVGTLSGGQRARVSLASALLGRPDVLVLDEPTVGLDPVLRQELWELFAALADEGTTLLVSSHVMDEAARCDRLLLVREGRLVADDTPERLMDRTGARDIESAFLALAVRSLQVAS